MNWRKEGSRFGKFLVVGTVGAVVDFGTFNLLTVIFHCHPNLAQAMSFGAAVVNNFLWNRYWTYPDSRSKRIYRQLIQFAVINAVGLLIRTPLFASLTPFWHGLLESTAIPLPISAVQASRNLALACAVLVVLIWNFVVNRLWTYNDVD